MKIKRLSKIENISVIINTHYPAHALEIADNCLMLMQNAKHKIGKTSDIICKENIKKDKQEYDTIIPISIAGD